VGRATPFNDLLALGVIRRFAERGVRVPGQISVVGYDPPVCSIVRV
jgi:LacI family transcriptional regulator